MNIGEPDENGSIEDLLREVPLSGASRKFDQRMEKLFRPRPGWAAGLAYGFAAGVVATACLMLAWPAAPIQRIEPPTVQAAGSSAPKAPTVQNIAIWAEPRQTVDQIEGKIDGVPVRIQVKRTKIDLQPANAGSGGWRSQVTLPQVVTVTPIHTY